MRKVLLCVSLASLLAGCAAGGSFWRWGGMQPRYSANANVTVIEQRHTTGTVAPQYYNEESVVIYGNGDWIATRVYPYTTPPKKEGIGAGMLSRDQLQRLVDVAFESPGGGQPRFIDLPQTVDSGAVGGGRRSIVLTLEGGTHSVAVNGPAPEAFNRLDDAIGAATVKLMP
ncbi:MAG TPA: hypothetical protein V6D05_07205 [Stenomitos sp.]